MVRTILGGHSVLIKAVLHDAIFSIPSPWHRARRSWYSTPESAGFLLALYTANQILVWLYGGDSTFGRTGRYGDSSNDRADHRVGPGTGTCGCIAGTMALTIFVSRHYFNCPSTSANGRYSDSSRRGYAGHDEPCAL